MNLSLQLFDLDYELAENIFKSSDKSWNKYNLKLHQCSEETPTKPGACIAYEQYDLDDQYLVVWTGEEWINFEYGNRISFGGKYREDHWSELPSKSNEENPCSKIELPRYIRTATNILYQLEDLMKFITHNNPEVYHKHDRKEIISEKTERAFETFRLLLNIDISNAKNSV